MELRQGPVGLPVRHRHRPAHHPAGPRRADRRAARGVAGARRWRVAAEGLRAARDGGHGVGVLTGGRLTVEDAYAYAKFARVALHTNDIDFRARPVSAEEADSWPHGRRRHRRHLRRRGAGAGRGAGRAGAGGGVPDPLPAAAQGVPEDGSCTVLRGGAVRHPRPEKLGATVLPDACPATRRGVLAERRSCGEALRQPGAILFVGERLADRPGWTVRRRRAGRARPAPSWPGCRGAPVTGARSTPAACRTCCPAAARSPTRPRGPSSADAWDLDGRRPPERAGPRHRRDHRRRRRRASSARWWSAGVDPADLADPRPAEQALDAVRLPGQPGAAAQRGDRSAPTWCFPVAPAVEKAGCYLNWEGRLRPFERGARTPPR